MFFFLSYYFEAFSHIELIKSIAWIIWNIKKSVQIETSQKFFQFFFNLKKKGSIQKPHVKNRNQKKYLEKN